MKKIDSSLLVCSAAYSQQLVALGILPIACMCYESTGGIWDFVGEYVGQKPVLPAWTMNELDVMIGGDYPNDLFKPEIYSQREWSAEADMLQYILYLPKSRKDHRAGADAYAAFLLYIINKVMVNPEDMKEYNQAKDRKKFIEGINARLEAMCSQEHFNPMTETLKKEAEEKRK